METAKDIQADARRIVPKRTGALMASIAVQADGDDALVGPTDSARSFNGAYGRAVELGGMRFAHNPSGRMWWHDGGWRSAVSNMMPSQPYLEPAVKEIADSGRAEKIYEDHWRRAQDAI